MDATVESNRAWVAQAVMLLDADQRGESATPLLRLDLPEFPNIDVYFKDETAHPSGSLKHRLARSLFLHGICNGDIREGTPVVEASSGSTAISESHFANLLGLPFVAVVPRGTAAAKLGAITQTGGRVHLADPNDDTTEIAAQLARDLDGHFMDQFTYAESATDWRGNNNIAESLFAQLSREPRPIPQWIVVGAGTGGTSATLGRYIRYRPELRATRLCVVDPEGSAFFAYFRGGDRRASGRCSGIVEGIGRARVERSFMRHVIDEMISIPDAASIAGARWLSERMGRRFGPSTGANVIGVLAHAALLHTQGVSGSLAALACDAGERYGDTIYDDRWLAERNIDLADWRDRLDQLRSTAQRFGQDLPRAHAAGAAALSGRTGDVR